MSADAFLAMAFSQSAFTSIAVFFTLMALFKHPGVFAAGAALYGGFLRVAEPLHGKELSYNNVVDIDAALALATEFLAAPEAAIAILKHNTPCGVGLGRDPLEAWQRALATDPTVYRSDEIDATYEIAINGSSLKLTRQQYPAKDLTRVSDDKFMTADFALPYSGVLRGDVEITFIRKSGEVDELCMDGRRLENFRFKKQP